MNEEIIRKVTPSGLPFEIRNLIGKDQDTLTRNMKKEGDRSAFNIMLTDALKSVGELTGDKINPKFVSNILSNDRAFMLIVMRQHSLDYKEDFDFNWEWPIDGKNKTQKVVQPYTVKLNHENFPVVPYKWMREHIAEAKAKHKLEQDEAQKEGNGIADFVEPDGHKVLFPELFASYADMLATHREIKGELPKSKVKYKWELLDGATEALYKNQLTEDMRINLMLEMRKPKWFWEAPTGLGTEKKTLWADLDTARYHIQDLEHLRGEIMDIEGNVDTTITIVHQNDTTRKERINLITMPPFFFPSLAR